MVSNKVQTLFSTKSKGTVLFVQEGDVGSRELTLELKQYNGTTYEGIDTTGCTVTIVYHYTDGDGAEQTSQAISSTRNDDGTFTTVIPASPLAQKGSVKAQVSLTNADSDLLNSAIIGIEVLESFAPGSTEDDPSVPVLVQLIANATAAVNACNTATAAIPTTIAAQKGAANGICPLDADGKIPLAYVPGSVEGPKYGVSGVGKSNPALTRIWDSVGLQAAVGTDSDTAINDFDSLAPFNRKRFVGSATVTNGKVYITPAAWHGDPDYTEDGSIGDYVAVRCYKTYYYQDLEAGILGVSAYPHIGWKLHELFIDEDGNELDYVDLPCYALALDANGKAVSLPGYRNECGDWAGLWTKCRTYDGDAGAYAAMTPIAAAHYETLLQTIEFATTDPQTVMMGFINGRYAADPISGVLSATQIVLTSTIGGYYKTGQNVYIGASYGSMVKASHSITSIENCDEDGTANASGTYRLVTLSAYADATDITTIDTPTINNRPYNTGACNDVLTPSGSPTSNSTGYYPCRYRWIENPWGNQFMTCQDLMDVRVEVDTEVYKLQWYYLPNIDEYMGAAIANPTTAAALVAKGWELLATETPAESYANGYIKVMTPDTEHPFIWIPTLTTGGSATTFFADYAYLVNSTVVRAVRLFGYWPYGRYAGPSYRYATNAPSIGHASYGAGLYFSRRGCAA